MSGAVCIIILRGGDALGAASLLEPNPQSAFLSAGIEGSCELAVYRSLYLQHEGKQIPASATDPIIEFHKYVIAHVATMTPEAIRAAGDKIHRLNEVLKDAEEPESS